MKFFFVLITLISFQAHATDQTQYIDCKFENPNNNDHVIVSLDDTQNGTFLYTAGVDDEDDNQHTGVIGLKRQGDKEQTAHFLAKWSTVQDGSRITVEFHFSMPKDLVFKVSNSFKSGLTTNIIDEQSKTAPLTSADDLTCFARLYPKNQSKTQKN